jgi:hypothetical protein
MNCLKKNNSISSWIIFSQILLNSQLNFELSDHSIFWESKINIIFFNYFEKLVHAITRGDKYIGFKKKIVKCLSRVD